MSEWLSDLNWWGGFGALCAIVIGAAFNRHGLAKPIDKPGCKSVK